MRNTSAATRPNGTGGRLALQARSGRASPAVQMAALLIYGTGLLTVLCLSAAYNLWPISQTKWLLRRFDHAAIYLLIASTYTPFLVQGMDAVCYLLLAAIWTMACAGMALKLAYRTLKAHAQSG